MLSKIASLKKSNLISIFIRTFVARGIAALGGLIFVIMLGQYYGPSGVGLFAIAQSIYIGSGILARYGMDHALMRYVGQDYLDVSVKHYLLLAIRKASFFSVIAACLVIVLSSNIKTWFSLNELDGILPSISLMIPAFTLCLVLSGFMKGVRKSATACLFENGSIMLVASGFLWLFENYTSNSIVNVGWSICLAAWFVLIQAILITLRWFNVQKFTNTDKLFFKKEFMDSSSSFFIMSLAQFMQQVLGIMIAGFLLSSEDLGLYRSAERAAFLITFVLLVINSVLPPRFAKLYKDGNLEQLRVLARKGSLFGMVLSFPLLLVCLIAPHWILQLFGTEFIEASNLLRILAIGQMINVTTGSVGFLLNMTGHERLMRNISLCCNGIGLVMFFVLIHFFGVLGAAVAMMFVLVLQNSVALIFVWTKLKICILPLPNFIIKSFQKIEADK